MYSYSTTASPPFLGSGFANLSIVATISSKSRQRIAGGAAGGSKIITGGASAQREPGRKKVLI
jgi:hypothetical protein